MFKENTPLTSLEARKQLLVAESELNRAQLLEEIIDFNHEISRFKHQAAEIGAMAASVAKVAATFSAVRRVFSHRAGGEKHSWLSTLLNGAKTGTTLWLLLRSFVRKT